MALLFNARSEIKWEAKEFPSIVNRYAIIHPNTYIKDVGFWPFVQVPASKSRFLHASTGYLFLILFKGKINFTKRV